MNRRMFLAAAIPFAVAGCGFRPFGFRPFTFVQIGDPQFGFTAGNDGNSFAVEADVLERVVRSINRMRPAPEFVAICGDLTHLPGHAAQIAAYRRIIGTVDQSIPVHTAPGNHDFQTSLSMESIEAYRKLFGPDRSAFEVRGWRFIALNSVLLQPPDKLPDELAAQTEWLKKTLADAKRAHARGIVAFMHHPFTDEDISGPAPEPHRRMYLDLFAENKVTAVFSAHTHRTVPEKTYRGVRLINTNGLVRSFDDSPGLRIVHVGADRIEHVFVPVKPGEDPDFSKYLSMSESEALRSVA